MNTLIYTLIVVSILVTIVTIFFDVKVSLDYRNRDKHTEDLKEEIEKLKDELDAKDELIETLKQNKGRIPPNDEC